MKYDVSFVGQPHGNRRQVISALRKAGINVYVWGGGWESGRLSQEEMIRVFNQSRINTTVVCTLTTNLKRAAAPFQVANDAPDRLSFEGRDYRLTDVSGEVVKPLLA